MMRRSWSRRRKRTWPRTNFGSWPPNKPRMPTWRKFAQEMVTDHTKANKDLNALATDKKWAVASGMSRDHQAQYDRLARMEGAAFDRQYLDDQLKDHEAAVTLFDDQSKTAPTCS